VTIDREVSSSLGFAARVTVTIDRVIISDYMGGVLAGIGLDTEIL
jgi:hypothetical protein